MARAANDFFVSGAAPGADRAKRLFDICAAALGLALCALPFAAIALAIRCEGSGAIFFRQRRIGKDGRVFRIWKFRTMRETTSQPMANLTVAGDQRITRVGAVLRATKIDELPQLINVLTGDMSLVGPRPETEDLIVHYTPAQRAVMLSIRPGVTDYASIALRHESELLEAANDPLQYYRETLMPIKYDFCERYLREMGLWTDIKIIFSTLATLVCRRPAMARATAARPELSAK
jgi:lipopolysaccharide/colanic/teichoic acid biosynthesis glycosyltransferase